MCNICKPSCVLVNANAETRPDELAGNNGADGGHHPCQGGRRRGLGRVVPGIRACDFPVLQACHAHAGRRRRRHDGSCHEIAGQAGAVRHDPVVFRVAVEDGSESLLGYAAAAQDSSGQRDGRSGKRATGASGPESTGQADRAAHERRGAEGAGQTGRAGAHGAGDALLLGHELRRNCRCAGSAARLCGRGAAARAARTAAGAGRQRRAGGGRSLLSETPEEKMKHLDEMTLLLYIERQLERTRGLEVSAHTQECDACRTLLRALERESRLLTRAMLEEDEPLPSRLAQFQERARRSMQWIWGLVFGLAATGAYALYTTYIQPWQQQLEQAGFGGSNLLGLLIFQGAMWKGWQSMITLLEVPAMLTLAGLVALFFRRKIRRGSALALVFAGLCAVLALPTAATASETRKGPSVGVSSEETIKGDIFLFGDRVKVDGTVEGDVFLFGHDAAVNGHVQGDVFGFAQTLQVDGQVDGNIRAFTNTLTIRGTVAKNVLTFDERVNLESAGKIGGSLTVFVEYLNLEGSLGRDLLVFGKQVTISGKVGGGIREKGAGLTITASGEVGGPIHYEGDTPAEVSSKAKLASPVETSAGVSPS